MDPTGFLSAVEPSRGNEKPCQGTKNKRGDEAGSFIKAQKYIFLEVKEALVYAREKKKRKEERYLFGKLTNRQMDVQCDAHHSMDKRVRLLRKHSKRN